MWGLELTILKFRKAYEFLCGLLAWRRAGAAGTHRLWTRPWPEVKLTVQDVDKLWDMR